MTSLTVTLRSGAPSACGTAEYCKKTRVFQTWPQYKTDPALQDICHACYRDKAGRSYSCFAKEVHEKEGKFLWIVLPGKQGRA